MRLFNTKNDVSDKRTLGVKKNVISSMGLKVISILISLQLVPLTIGYVNSSRYGIWLTLSSVIGWLAYFDLGFGNGFRNKFAESVANGNTILARKYVSTTYAILTILFTIVFVLASVANLFINWPVLLNLDVGYQQELTLVFQILVFFFCLNMIGTIMNTILTADQKPAIASLLTTIGQLLAFVAIFVLTRTTEGNLIYLAFAYSGIPCIFLIVCSFFFFRFKRYQKYTPSIHLVDFSLAKNILKIGVEFFMLMFSVVIVFQCINIIISRQSGPIAVTQYNVAYQYMNVLYMVFSIILIPIWSAVTNAYTLGDYQWIKKTKNKIDVIFLLFVFAAFLMVIISPFIYKIWIRDSVEIDIRLTVIIAVFIIMHMFAGANLYFINGIGKLRVQLVVYIPFVLISIPLMNTMCKAYGVEGCIIVPTVVYLVQAIFARIQINKLISGTAKGIWNK